MNCPGCGGFDNEFTPQRARKLLRSYRDSGPNSTTRKLTGALQDSGVQGLSVLDIGGGIGAVQFALLDAGAERALSVEAAGAYLEVAAQEAQRRGLANRIEHKAGDFVALSNEVPAADIVTLDRVICCYHDMPSLVSLAAERATHYFGAVFPRDRWWVKVWNLVENLVHWMQRSAFRSYVHSPAEIDACLRANGLLECFSDQSLAWHIVVYRRPAAD